jgi:hypothetical protein
MQNFSPIHPAISEEIAYQVHTDRQDLHVCMGLFISLPKFWPSARIWITFRADLGRCFSTIGLKPSGPAHLRLPN